MESIGAKCGVVQWESTLLEFIDRKNTHKAKEKRHKKHDTA
jgi:hypothetical protein